MQIGMIGLGRMGGNMARRLQRAGHRCVVHARHKETLAEFTAAGMVTAASPAELVALLEPPRPIWIMLPAGEVTEGMVETLGTLVSPGDMVIDGGNTFYKDDIRRAEALEAKGIAYLDVGTSGGIWGLERGYCLMIGGPKGAVEHLEPIFADLAPGGSGIEPAAGREGRDRRAERGYIHAGPSGAGHFVKMVHNGIEYGLMQAYAEGFDLLRGNGRYDFDLADIAEVWRRGSVVSSWLLDLTAAALAADDNLSRFTGSVADSGEGRWTIEAAIESGVPVHVLAASLFARFRSRKEATFADKLLSAMRFEFGGHVEPPRGP